MGDSSPTLTEKSAKSDDWLLKSSYPHLTNARWRKIVMWVADTVMVSQVTCRSVPQNID